MGRKTDASVIVVEMIAKRISFDPWCPASIGVHALFDFLVDIFQHDDGVVDDDTG